MATTHRCCCRRRLALAVLALCACAAASSISHAQQQDLERFQRQLEQIRRDTILEINPDVPLGQRTYIDYGAYVTFGYLSLDDNVDENHVLRQYELFPYFRLNIDGAHEFFLRGRVGWRDFNDGDSFDGRGDERIDPDLDAGYYRFDLARSRAAYAGEQLDYNVVFKGGRDLVYWANGLVLSQDIDGVMVDLSWRTDIGLSLIAGVTPTRTVDFDASRPNFDHNTRRGFYGAMLSKAIGRHRPYVYGLVQRDYNDDDPLVQGPVSTEFEYDSHYLGVGSAGSFGDRWLYGVELVHEGGSGLSNSFSGDSLFIEPIPQTKEDIDAWAANLRVDYLLADVRRSRFTGEVIVASGDDDRVLSTSDTFGGNTPGTDDNAFNGFGLLNTGLAFAPQVSNLTSFRVGASTFPFADGGGVLSRIQIGADWFVFYRTDSDAVIDEPLIPGSEGERYLGWEPDVFLNWQITSDVTLSIRYGLFFPNDDVFESDEPRHFIHTGVTYAF
ncbi:MAG TPA: alginate export family protein [Tepidisphaeraceae bacterium]|nr:alginate export family protein [Tepidisphaeraceae bacterium]